MQARLKADSPMTRDTLLDMLAQFAAQRPGLDPRDYISDWRDTEGRRTYFAEARSLTRDLHQARELLAAVRRATSIDVAALRAVLSPAGRLSLDGDALSYTAGQCYSTEYRAAVCRALASALWAYYRDHCCADTGDKIRKAARRELSRGVAQRWFA